MANCVEELKALFPDFDDEFIETMNDILEKVRKNPTLSLDQKVKKYKDLLQRGKAARAKRVKDKIQDELKLNRNVEIGMRPRIISNKDKVLSNLENIEGNELTVDSIADSNENLLLGQLDVKIRQEGLEEAVKSDVYSREVMEVMHSGVEKKGTDAKSIIINKLAKIYKAMNEKQRRMMNNSGASIFKRNDYVHRQFHNGERMSAVKPEEWVEDIKEALDLEESFPDLDPDEIDAKLLSDYKRFIDRHEATLGYVPEGIRDGSFTRNNTIDILNKGRTYKFKDGGAFFDYNAKYGTEASLHARLTTDYKRSARKAALIHIFGSSPKQGFDNFKSNLFNRLGLTNAEATALSEVADEAFAIANGKGTYGITNTLAKVSMGVRGWNIITMLGKAALSAGMDIVPTIMNSKTATGENLFRASIRSTWKTLQAFDPATKKAFMEQTLISADAFSRNMKDSLLGASHNEGFINRQVNAMFKYSGLNWVTGVSRRANASLAIEDLASIVNSKKLNTEQKNFISRYGFTPKEISALKGMEYITPERLIDTKPKDIGLRRKELDDLVQKTHVMINQRVNRGSPVPDARSRRRLGLGSSAGTAKGEAIRHFAQFKSTIMKITQDIEFMNRASSATGNLANRDTFRTAAQFFTMATSVGLMRNLAVEVLKRDEDFDIEEFLSNPVTWTRAAVTGGGLAIYGDLLSSVFRGGTGRDLLTSLGVFVGGPTGGRLAKAYDAIVEGVTDGPGDKAARFAVESIPGQNLWYMMNANTALAEMLGTEFEDIFD